MSAKTSSAGVCATAVMLALVLASCVVRAAGLPVLSVAPKATRRPIPADFESSADALMSRLADEGSFSGAVLVARDGEVVFSRGYGYADRERRVPVTAQTRFPLSFAATQFSALAVLMLRDQGKLDVQDSICDYLTDCPAAWQPVTIHHLLTQQSGLPDYLNALITSRRLATPMPPENVVAMIADDPLRFQPGERVEFWNRASEPYLISLIIERASGVSYEDLLQRRIFTPLGLHDTGAVVGQQGLASGYNESAQEVWPDPSTVRGVGSIYTTVGDLLRWEQALHTEQLVSQDLLDEMARVQGSFNGPDASATERYGASGVAYGWTVGEQFGRLHLFTGWFLPGFSSYIGSYPDDGVTVIVLCNQRPSDPFGVARKLADLFF